MDTTKSSNVPIKLYLPEEIADIFRISIHTARDWIMRGDFGETIRAGRRHLVTQKGLDMFIETHTGPAHETQTAKVKFGRTKKQPKAAKL